MAEDWSKPSSSRLALAGRSGGKKDCFLAMNGEVVQIKTIADAKLLQPGGNDQQIVLLVINRDRQARLEFFEGLAGPLECLVFGSFNIQFDKVNPRQFMPQDIIVN